MSGKTPNLDKLASRGMRSNDYYAEASYTAGSAGGQRRQGLLGSVPGRSDLRAAGIEIGARSGFLLSTRTAFLNLSREEDRAMSPSPQCIALRCQARGVGFGSISFLGNPAIYVESQKLLARPICGAAWDLLAFSPRKEPADVT